MQFCTDWQQSLTYVLLKTHPFNPCLFFFFLISTLSLLTTYSFFYDMYSCFACMSVVHCMHAWLPRRRHWLPCNWTYGWCRESNPGPLYEQQILLNMSHLSSPFLPMPYRTSPYLLVLLYLFLITIHTFEIRGAGVAGN